MIFNGADAWLVSYTSSTVTQQPLKNANDALLGINRMDLESNIGGAVRPIQNRRHDSNGVNGQIKHPNSPVNGKSQVESKASRSVLRSERSSRSSWPRRLKAAPNSKAWHLDPATKLAPDDTTRVQITVTKTWRSTTYKVVTQTFCERNNHDIYYFVEHKWVLNPMRLKIIKLRHEDSETKIQDLKKEAIEGYETIKETTSYVLTDELRKLIYSMKEEYGYTDIEQRSGSPFVVIGMFNYLDSVPKERLFTITCPKLVFWQLWWNVMKLRGIRYFFSLKDVKHFRIYQCNWLEEFHERLQSGADEEAVLAAFSKAYRSWRYDKDDWTMWIHDSLNYASLEPMGCPLEKALSLEIVLGWSPIRISIVVLSPILLSVILGFWFQWQNPTDLATIQTAWGLASYVGTAGGLLAALLGILSSVGDR